MGKNKFVVAKIVIKRIMTDGDDTIWYSAIDESGEDLALVQTLGMLRLTEDTVIRDRMGEVPDSAREEMPDE